VYPLHSSLLLLSYVRGCSHTHVRVTHSLSTNGLRAHRFYDTERHFLARLPKQQQTRNGTAPGNSLEETLNCTECQNIILSSAISDSLGGPWTSEGYHWESSSRLSCSACLHYSSSGSSLHTPTRAHKHTHEHKKSHVAYHWFMAAKADPSLYHAFANEGSTARDLRASSSASDARPALHACIIHNVIMIHKQQSSAQNRSRTLADASGRCTGRMYEAW